MGLKGPPVPIFKRHGFPKEMKDLFLKRETEQTRCYAPIARLAPLYDLKARLSLYSKDRGYPKERKNSSSQKRPRTGPSVCAWYR